MNQGIPDHDSSTLRIAAVYGAEYHPEYFGAYPAPIHTPWGYMLRYHCIENGIFWLETDQRQEVLTICYPIWDASLSKEAVRLGVTMECSQEYGSNTLLSYIFFKKPDACVPIFELMRTRQEWGKTGRITAPALMNAIWQNHPGYVLIHNTREQRTDSLCVGVKLLLAVSGNDQRENRFHHPLVAGGEIVQKLLALFALQLHVIGNHSGKIVVAVLPSLPI